MANSPTRKSRLGLSLLSTVKVAGRLAPKQLIDEGQLALQQMKKKGVQVGIAGAFGAVALVLLAFMAIALIVAIIAGLSNIFQPWAAALIVAGVFLIIAAILGAIAATRVKAALPLVPEDAIRGIKYDLGILKEGSSFDARTLDKDPAEEAKKKAAKQREKAAQAHEVKPQAPSYNELLTRANRRRQHLTELRDGLGEKVDVKSQFAGTKARFQAERAAHKTTAPQNSGPSAAQRATALVGTAQEKLDRGIVAFSDTSQPIRDDAAKLVKDRWQPLAVMGGSLAAMAYFIRKLGEK
ncbi:hypothetical protein HD598_000235 [Neomicrococcus aestuarii]|uniref:Phage holin family protein n=1 Tax=Neomicrococcus aestuarii TaxID=556325 RepID=A0A7W8WZ83_9MICC|nr:phage holin family protein [Neomicrococcus aestuarii]MBB5511548.1 hypothetical protein [Neomicrococcus aestuarii]